MSQPGDDPATTAYVYTVLHPALKRLAEMPPVVVAGATADVYEFKFFQATGEVRRYVDRDPSYFSETSRISEACTLIYTLVEDINTYVEGYSLNYFRASAPFDNFLSSFSRAFRNSTYATKTELAQIAYYASFQRDADSYDADSLAFVGDLDVARSIIVNELETVRVQRARFGAPAAYLIERFATSLPLSRAVRRETRECVRVLNFAPAAEFAAKLQQLDYFVQLVSRNPAVSVPSNLMDQVSWALAEGDLTFAGPRTPVQKDRSDRSPWVVWDPVATARAPQVAERRDLLRQLVLNINEDPGVATLQQLTGRLAEISSVNPLERGAHWGDEDLPY